MRPMTDCLTFLQANLWAPERSPLLDQLRRLMAAEQPAVPGWEDLLSDAARALADLTEGEFRRQYSAVFEYTQADLLIPLWESAYAEGRQILLDETTLEVTRTYYASGLRPAGSEQPADYIGYEVDYLLHLLRVAGDRAGAAAFWRDHARVLVRGVAETILAAGEKAGRYYPALAQLMLRMDRLWTDEEASPAADGGRTLHFEPLTPEEAEKALEERVIHTSGRGNCGSKCVIRAHVTAGCVTRLESDVEDPETFAMKACAKGRGYRKTFLGADRLRYPMLRVGERGEGKFQRISWDEALDLMAEKLTELTAKYGPGCRYVQYASGVSAVVRGDVVMSRLLGKMGGYLGRYNTYSSACSGIAIPYTYGTITAGSHYATYKKSRMLILWGDNPVVTRFNDRLFSCLRYLKEHQVPIVVIDPQFSDTAAVFATQWIPIRPGTDSALATAMAYVILDRGLQDQHFMDTYCLGFDRDHMPEGCEDQESFRDYVFGTRDGVAKTPAWASAITGIPEQVITDLAVQYATAKPAAIVPGLGPQRHANGEQSVRSVTVLPALTGNVGVEGGSTGAAGFLVQHAVPKVDPGPNPYGASIPCFLWTDAVTRGTQMTAKADHVRGKDRLESDIKLIFNLAGNTLINQHSDINRTVRILKDPSLCEFIVVSDLFMTPSARYADLLLPGTSLFEGDNITVPWREGDFLLYGNQVIPPLFESRFEFDWILELAKRMGVEDLAEGCQDLRSWLALLYERVRAKEPELPEFPTFAAEGGYRYRNNRVHVAFREQIEDPAHHPFPTESGKIEIFSKALLAFEEPEEIPPIPKYVPAFEGVGDPRQARFPLQLIGWHTKRRYHSTHDNSPWMEQVEPHRVWVHPEDAAPRGITENALVQVYNDRGTVEMRAHLSRRIMKGVVCIPQGAWYTPDGRGVDVRGSVNSLTTARPTPLAKGNPQHSNLVELRLAEEGQA